MINDRLNFPLIIITQRIRDARVDVSQLLLVLQYIEQTESEYAEHMKAQWEQEEKEEPVISSADAIIHPRAMMIERLKNIGNIVTKCYRENLMTI